MVLRFITLIYGLDNTDSFAHCLPACHRHCQWFEILKFLIFENLKISKMSNLTKVIDFSRFLGFFKVWEDTQKLGIQKDNMEKSLAWTWILQKFQKF